MAPASTQLDHGYSIHPAVFERAEMSAAVMALNGPDVVRTRAGARHVLGVPAVSRIASDPRLLSLAANFVGPTPVPFRATLFSKSPTANWLVVWHQDTALPLRTRIDDPEWGPWSTKDGILYAHAPAWALEQVVALRICLDDSTASNGPLRILPETHRGGVLDEAEIERLAARVSPADCVAAAGGVVAMRPLVIHASSKATDDQPRRVLHVEYSPSTVLGGVVLAVA